MSDSPQIKPSRSEPEDARDLQAKLYREIGIFAVAAALRSISQPQPGKPAPEPEAADPTFALRAVRAA